MRLTLTKQQYEYLKSNLSNEREDLYEKLNESTKDNSLFELNEIIAYEIRDWASERLQQIGFDKNYRLTKEGQIIEDIIDVFYR